MNRRALNLPIPDADLMAAASLEPSGRHMLELDLAGMAHQLAFSLDQARWLRKACEEFEAECAFDDGRPRSGAERLRRVRVPLMQGFEVGQI